MMGIACVRASRLLAKRASGLNDAERLQLEGHLAGCHRCSEDARDMSALMRLALSDLVPSLGSRARERALSSALRAAGAPAHAPRRTLPRWMPAVAVSVAAAAVALAVHGGSDDATSRAPGVAEAPAPHPRAPAAMPAPMPAGEELSFEEPTEMTAAHAVVRFEAGSRARWHAEASTLRLRTGAVSASVDRAAGASFRVRTRRFIAEVTGTELEVTPRSVRVTEGTVRVIAPSGEIYVDELGAGEEWRAPVVVPSRPAPAPPVIDDLLSAARGKLAAGDIDGARDELARALDARPSRAERAEAQTLLAECELVAGNAAVAARLYLQVANRYRNLRAGETALFAAARTHVDAGHTVLARKTLTLYLERYPDGRFRDEAKNRLHALD